VVKVRQHLYYRFPDSVRPAATVCLIKPERFRTIFQSIWIERFRFERSRFFCFLLGGQQFRHSSFDDSLQSFALAILSIHVASGHQTD
jgi:hypothetical protein